MNRYSITQHTKGSYSDRNGRTVAFDGWKEVLVLDAPRAGTALRAADQKWPGKFHRARLIQSPLCATLSTADRADIRAYTTQTI
jgi:hypothetical protein